MTSENHYFEHHSFPREINNDGIRSLFGFIDGRIGSSTDLAMSGEDSNRYTLGFISKNYEEGIAYAEMTFGTRDPSFVRPKCQKWCGLTLTAETPYQKRKDLTERLNKEVKASLDSYFMTH